MVASVPSAITERGMPSAKTYRGMSLPSWIPAATWWLGISTTPGAESCQSPMEMATPTHPLPSLVTSTPSVTAGIIMMPKQGGIISTPGIMIPKSNGLSMRMGLLARMEFTGYNLFAYCNNSPVRFNDPSGTYINDTSHVSHRNPGGGYGIPGGLKYEVGFNYLDYAIRPASPYTNVSVSYSVNQTDDVSKELLPDDPIMYATQGVKTQTTVASIGDSSKPVSFYATHDINDPSTLVSSVGIKLNFNDLTISANLGKTNIGISGSLKNGDTSKSLSAKFNMSKMRAGVEGATTQWDGNMSVTEYRELGVNTTGVVVVAVAFFAKVLGPKTAIA